MSFSFLLSILSDFSRMSSSRKRRNGRVSADTGRVIGRIPGIPAKYPRVSYPSESSYRSRGRTDASTRESCESFASGPLLTSQGKPGVLREFDFSPERKVHYPINCLVRWTINFIQINTRMLIAKERKKEKTVKNVGTSEHRRGIQTFLRKSIPVLRDGRNEHTYRIR